MVFVFYTYNSLGYITNVKKNGTTIASYSYDALGRLVGETVNNQIYIYSYDKAGNITQKLIFTGDIGNLTDTINYTYSTSAWGDLLTNYDGTAITYDSIGNPTKWRNSSSLTWDGRTLTSQTLTNGNSISYKYNSDGIRTQKRVFDDVASAYITHDYVLDGTKIVQETVTDNAYYNSYTLYYVYDANGSITGLHYNGSPYYFQKNIQGDVLRICNAGGAVVVEYTYDAWGNILSVTGSMASTLGKYNPFRYRGYYYDSETDLYYLNSRYYDADVGRFINADGIVGANGGLQGYNMFAYCNNNPVAFADPTGYVLMNVSGNDVTSSQYLLMRDYGGLYSGGGGCGFTFTARQYSKNGALHDSSRTKPENLFKEELLAYEFDVAYDVIQNGLGLNLDVAMFTGAWEWENFKLALLDFGYGNLTLGFFTSEEGEIYAGASAMVCAYAPSAAITIGRLEIEVQALVGAYGFQAEWDNGLTIGAAKAVGASISFNIVDK